MKYRAGLGPALALAGFFGMALPADSLASSAAGSAIPLEPFKLFLVGCALVLWSGLHAKLIRKPAVRKTGMLQQKERRGKMKSVRNIFTVSTIAVIVLGVAMLSGCTSYYKVKDTSTDKVFYTTQIDRQSSGSIRFVDENSKSVVTLQNSAVTEVNEEEFKANTKKK